MKPFVVIWKFYPEIGHVNNFEILEPLYIFGMTKDRNVIFGAHIDYDMF